MKDKILNLLNEKDYQRKTVDELAEQLNATNSDQFKELVKELVGLEQSYVIQRDKEDRYDLLTRFGQKRGKIQIHKNGYGFVKLLDEESNDVFVPKPGINGAFNRDIVLITIAKKKTGQNYEGEVVKIIERDTSSIVGVYYEEKNVGYVKSDDSRYTQKIIINKNNIHGAMPDHKVKVEIINYIGNDMAEGKVIEILGHKNDPGIDILSVVYSHGIPSLFPPDVIEQANQFKDEITELDRKGRRDLRDEMIVTIDGADAKDLDDAVQVTRLENGNYRLGVHIADVSYYVREGDAIDKEAYRRGTSTYLADRVIPMIPHRLSNGICSLNPHVDRLVISCMMDINPSGKVEAYEMFPAVIRTTERMTYTAVNQILVEKDPEVIKQYQNLVPMFEDMQRLYKILNRKRKERGSINFETNESKIIVNEDGFPLDIQLRTRDVAEKLIEEFMLMANETVAEHFHWLNIPFLYRIHEDPSEEKIRRFFTLLNALGYKIKGKENGIHPKAFQEVLEKVEGQKEEAVINTMLVRSMAKARYSEQSLGHYGLATAYYTHFTSPIRRYPDTIVHRLIREYHFEGNVDAKHLDKYSELLKDIAQQTSQCERRSIDCEREVDDMKKAEFMMDKVGQEFEGIISSVTNWGIYVELPNTVEGLVHVLDMTDDFYEFSPETMSLIGQRHKKIFRIGDDVSVKVTSASKEEREIDFEIVGIKPRNRQVTESKGESVDGKKTSQKPRDGEKKTRNRRHKKTVQAKHNKK